MLICRLLIFNRFTGIEVYLLFIFLQDQEFSDNDAFFAWTFVNKRPLWQTLLSLSWPVLTLAICLFPVYPHQAKLLILYSCAGVLLLILCLLLGKSVILVYYICWKHILLAWSWYCIISLDFAFITHTASIRMRNATKWHDEMYIQYVERFKLLCRRPGCDFVLCLHNKL